MNRRKSQTFNSLNIWAHMEDHSFQNLFKMIDNGIVTLHDLFEIDTKNISQNAFLQFLKLVFISNLRKSKIVTGIT